MNSNIELYSRPVNKSFNRIHWYSPLHNTKSTAVQFTSVSSCAIVSMRAFALKSASLATAINAPGAQIVKAEINVHHKSEYS